MSVASRPVLETQVKRTIAFTSTDKGFRSVVDQIVPTSQRSWPEVGIWEVPLQVAPADRQSVELMHITANKSGTPAAHNTPIYDFRFAGYRRTNAMLPERSCTPQIMEHRPCLSGTFGH